LSSLEHGGRAQGLQADGLPHHGCGLSRDVITNSVWSVPHCEQRNHSSVSGTSPRPSATRRPRSASAWCRHDLHSTSTRTKPVRTMLRAVGRPSSWLRLRRLPLIAGAWAPAGRLATCWTTQDGRPLYLL